MSECPLCLSPKTTEYSRDRSRSYEQCLDCSLVFVPRTELLEVDQEKKRYEAHQNGPDDPVYKSYLSQIVSLIVPHLKLEGRGLDFGCGKTDLLAQLFKEKKIDVDSFDVFFRPDLSIWQKKYDFIVLSEVIEHLRGPRIEMLKLRDLLNPGGQIFIKTKFLPLEKAEFGNWFYKRDNTHVQFFSPSSFQQMGKILNLNGPQILGEDLSRFTT